jgi:hypothetical protein
LIASMRRFMNASAPSRGLGPFAALAISLAWLVVLAPLAYPYLKNGQQIAEIKDSYRLLAIAWVSSVGAIIASFSDIARNADKWNPHRAIWFAVRPLTGAAFGAIGYLIYYTIIQLSVAERAQMQGPETPTILGYVVAFTLGYREELFRELLKRVTDLLATAGATGRSAPWSWGRPDPTTARPVRPAASGPHRGARGPRRLAPGEMRPRWGSPPLHLARALGCGLAAPGHAATPAGLGQALRLRLLGSHGIHDDGVHVAAGGQLVEPLHRQQGPLAATLARLDHLDKHILVAVG